MIVAHALACCCRLQPTVPDVQITSYGELKFAAAR
jgi:hypothetical protein